MARVAVINEVDVASAATELLAEGRAPTLRAVRDRLGNVGSMGTIARHLQSWRAGQVPGPARPVSLPPVLQRLLADFVAQERALERAPVAAGLAERQAENADLAVDNERLAATIEDLREQIEQISLAKAVAEGRAGQLALELTRARVELDAERAARASAEIAHVGRAAQQDELENRLAVVTAFVERERAEAAGARANAERLAEQLVEGIKRLPMKARAR